MKKWVFLYFSLYFYIAGKGQNNLVPNASFENITTCPTGTLYTSELPFASSWQNPTQGTPDLFSTCDTTTTNGGPPFFGVPFNAAGYQSPHTGNNYAGIEDWEPSFHINAREYVQVQLKNSLIKNKKYCTSFYVSLSENSSCATSRLGCFISQLPVSLTTSNNINVLPQIEPSFHNYISDIGSWTEIKGIYTAMGGENCITIGNFYNDLNTDTLYVGGTYPWNRSSYYYLDDVSLVEYDTAYAGRDTNICKGLKIPLGVTSTFGASYNWSVLSGDANSIIDSSTVSTIYVKPSISTSYVLQKQQCGIFSYDTVRVYVKPSYTANAGADANICIGDSAVIGSPAICKWCTYNWQPVQTAYQNYTQLTVYPLAGTTYTLSVKDSCFTTYSDVTVNVAYCYSPVISVPNIFSPNADGINDTWQPVVSSGQLSLINYTCTVYDRWGIKVFDATASAPDSMAGTAWDGHTTAGIAASEGTYYYVISYTDAKTNEHKTLKGFLDLVR